MQLAYGTSDPLHDLRAFDVDGDGDLDLTVARGSEGGWLQNSNGTFGEFVPLVTGLHPARGWFDEDSDRFMLMHANGDGFPDAVAMTDGPTVPFQIVLRLGTGPGSFGPPAVVDLNESLTCAFEAVDIDLDGDMDIASYEAGIGGGAPEQIAFPINDGAGGFPAAPALLNTSGSNREMEFLDLDGDGLLDLLVTDDLMSSGSYSWFRHLGNGAFGSRQTLEALDRISRLHTTDVDGDGLRDLVVASSGTRAAFWRRNLGGTFGPHNELGPATYFAGGGSLVADLNGDGWEDLLVARRPDNVISLNRASSSNPGFGPPTFTPPPLSGHLVYFSSDDRDGDLLRDITYLSERTDGVDVLRRSGVDGSYEL
ncbi:MAG: VCBS repeat-containing protein, partial [Planctomycetota bacterium]